MYQLSNCVPFPQNVGFGSKHEIYITSVVSGNKLLAQWHFVRHSLESSYFTHTDSSFSYCEFYERSISLSAESIPHNTRLQLPEVLMKFETVIEFEVA